MVSPAEGGKGRKPADGHASPETSNGAPKCPEARLRTVSKWTTVRAAEKYPTSEHRRTHRLGDKLRSSQRAELSLTSRLPKSTPAADPPSGEPRPREPAPGTFPPTERESETTSPPGKTGSRPTPRTRQPNPRRRPCTPDAPAYGEPHPQICLLTHRQPLRRPRCYTRC